MFCTKKECGVESEESELVGTRGEEDSTIKVAIIRNKSKY
jgi:hypothetical protein